MTQWNFLLFGKLKLTNTWLTSIFWIETNLKISCTSLEEIPNSICFRFRKCSRSSKDITTRIPTSTQSAPLVSEITIEIYTGTLTTCIISSIFSPETIIRECVFVSKKNNKKKKKIKIKSSYILVTKNNYSIYICIYIPVWIDNRKDIIVSLQRLAIFNEIINDVSYSCWGYPFSSMGTTIDP